MENRRTTSTRSRRRLAAGLSLGLTLAAAAFVAACADAPSAPLARSAQLAKAPASAPAAVGGVLRDEPLAADITVQQTIGPEGGELQIKEAGMKLEVPAGAVSAPTVFTATALAGRAVAYEFGPSGTFPVALTIKQDLKGTNGLKQHGGSLTGAYVRDLSTIDRTTGDAQADEFEPTSVDVGNSKIEISVSHFSGYMVSWGRY